jgi:hypothetical protein
MLLKPWACLVCGIGFLALGTSARAQTLYGSTAAGSPGELYRLDAATGSVLQDIGPLNDANGVNYPITGLAFHPVSGVLYASTGNFVPATAAQLVRINPATALVTVIGPFNVGNAGSGPATMADLAFDPATATLFGVGSIAGPQLYSINTGTGQATVIGGTGLTSTTGGGLAVSISGAIYGTPTAARFGTYDRITGAFMNIANPVKPVGGAYAALDFNSTGTLFGLDLGPTPAGGQPPTHLVTIDPATGAVIDLGASVAALDAIAFAPEPATPMLLGAALIGLISRRRRSSSATTK